MDRLKLKLSDQMLSNLLRWESLYDGHQQMMEKYGGSKNSQIRAALEEFTENLERIEIELQSYCKKMQ